MFASTVATWITAYDLDAKQEILYCASLGLVFTALRWVGNYFVLGHARIHQVKEDLTKAERLFEEVWLLILSSILLCASWAVFFDNGVGASLTHTLPIVHNWPNNVVKMDVVYLLRIETGWYMHQVTRGVSATGVPIDNLMFYHHIGSLVIIAFCYVKNLFLVGVLTLSVFNISNPFLHLSKVAYVMDLRRMRAVLFGLFGLVFFFSRVVMFPLTVMKMGYMDAYEEDVESFGEHLLLVGNLLLLILYALQIFWMFKIIRVLARGRTGTTPKKSAAKETPFSDAKPPANGKLKDN